MNIFTIMSPRPQTIESYALDIKNSVQNDLAPKVKCRETCGDRWHIEKFNRNLLRHLVVVVVMQMCAILLVNKTDWRKARNRRMCACAHADVRRQDSRQHAPFGVMQENGAETRPPRPSQTLSNLQIPFFVFQSVIPSLLYLGEEPRSYLLLYLCALSVKKYRSFLEVWGKLNCDLTTIVMLICLLVNGASVCMFVFLLSFLVCLFISLAFFGNQPTSNWVDPTSKNIWQALFCAPKRLYLNNEHVNASNPHFWKFFDQLKLAVSETNATVCEIWMHYNLRPATGNVMVNCIFQKP